MTTRPNLQTLGFTRQEQALFRRLNTPGKIQSFVSALPHNFEDDGDSCMSVREVLRTNRAHCIEAALLAALALAVHGHEPLIMDLSANEHDDDHVIALFRHNGLWGAISKSNHAVLRYRDPIYRTPRELALSYVHEYTNAKGEKTLRSYSRPISLSRIPLSVWVTGLDAWTVAEATCTARHYTLFPHSTSLRPLDAVQLRAQEITEHVRSEGKAHLRTS